MCEGVKGGVSVFRVRLCKQKVWILRNKRTTVHVFLLACFKVRGYTDMQLVGLKDNFRIFQPRPYFPIFSGQSD